MSVEARGRSACKRWLADLRPSSVVYAIHGTGVSTVVVTRVDSQGGAPSDYAEYNRGRVGLSPAAKANRGRVLLGTWYLSLAGSLLLVLVGMYIHWSVVVLGLLLPFLPMVSFVLARRTERRRAAGDPGRGDGSSADKQP